MSRFNTASEFIENLRSGSEASGSMYPESVVWAELNHPSFESDQEAVFEVAYSGSSHVVVMDLRLLNDKKFEIGNFYLNGVKRGLNYKGYQIEADAIENLKKIAIS